MDDREVGAASAAADPTGLAVAYDEYAAGLYGYCHWMLGQAPDAAEALRDTFITAAVTLSGFFQAPDVCPRLYALARNECWRRLASEPAVRGEGAGPADRRADVNGDLEQAGLGRLVRGALAELAPSDREVIELNLRHGLYDADLAIVLGVPWSQAHALASRARGRLENALGPLLLVRTGQEACPVLAQLLAGRDGQPTEGMRDLVGCHIEQCGVCAGRSGSMLRPAVLSGLLPMAALPPGLREQILEPSSGLREQIPEPSSGTTADAVADPPQMARGTQPRWLARFSHAISLVRWDYARDHPGRTTAAVLVVLWVAAAVGVTALTLASSHPAGALAVRPSASTAANSPAAGPAITAPAAATAAPSASAKPSPAIGQRAAAVAPAGQPSALPTPGTASPSSTPATSPSSAATSPSPRATSHSPSAASPSPSAKTSTSPSPKPSNSPSPTSPSLPSASHSSSSPA